MDSLKKLKFAINCAYIYITFHVSINTVSHNFQNVHNPHAQTLVGWYYCSKLLIALSLIVDSRVKVDICDVGQFIIVVVQLNFLNFRYIYYCRLSICHPMC